MSNGFKMISGVTYAKEYGSSKPMKDYMAGKITKEEYVEKIKEYNPLVRLDSIEESNGSKQILNIQNKTTGNQ